MPLEVIKGVPGYAPDMIRDSVTSYTVATCAVPELTALLANADQLLALVRRAQWIILDTGRPEVFRYWLEDSRSVVRAISPHQSGNQAADKRGDNNGKD